MSYKLKLDKAVKELNENGLKTTTPFIASWAAKAIGIKLPPPHYCSFTSNFISASLSIGFTWFLMLYLLKNINPDDIYFANSYRHPIFSSLVMGSIFGLFIATSYKWQSSKKRLSKWSSL